MESEAIEEPQDVICESGRIGVFGDRASVRQSTPYSERAVQGNLVSDASYLGHCRDLFVGRRGQEPARMPPRVTPFQFDTKPSPLQNFVETFEKLTLARSNGSEDLDTVQAVFDGVWWKRRLAH